MYVGLTREGGASEGSFPLIHNDAMIAPLIPVPPNRSLLLHVLIPKLVRHLMNLSCRCRESALVNPSAGMSLVGIQLIRIRPA